MVSGAVDEEPTAPPLIKPALPIRFGKVTHYARSGRASAVIWVPAWGQMTVS
jgi:hypothetical protein